MNLTRRLTCRMRGHRWGPWSPNLFSLHRHDIAELGYEARHDRRCGRCDTTQTGYRYV